MQCKPLLVQLFYIPQGSLALSSHWKKGRVAFWINDKFLHVNLHSFLSALWEISQTARPPEDPCPLYMHCFRCQIWQPKNGLGWKGLYTLAGRCNTTGYDKDLPVFPYCPYNSVLKMKKKQKNQTNQTKNPKQINAWNQSKTNQNTTGNWSCRVFCFLLKDA